jgi:hypothetical protein
LRGTSGHEANTRLKKSLGRSFVATLLQQDIELSAVLIHCSPQQRRLAAQRHEHFVQMPRGAGLATRSLDAMRKASAGSSHGSRSLRVRRAVPRRHEG